MKRSKFAITLLLLLLLSLVLVACNKESEGLTYQPFTYDSNGNPTSYYVSGIGTCTDKDIVIPSTYNGLPVVNIGSHAFEDCTGLRSITIPDSVTSIDSWAFCGCTGLTSVTIGNGATSIGTRAFNNCTGLMSIDVQENNPIYYSEGNCIIERETNSLILGCKNSTIPDNVTSIGLAFANCTGLTSITIPDSVTSIGYYAFYNCMGLMSIDVNENNPIYYSEGNCIIERETNSLILGCKNSTIPDSVTSIGLAFAGCTGLTSISIPDSVTSIDSCAFYGCTGLTSVTIGNGVTSIGTRAFYICTGLMSIDVQENNPIYYSEGNCIIERETNSLILGCKNSTIPDSVTSIDSWAFDGCTGLTNITIPDSVKSIGWCTFLNCTGLTSITIPDSVTSIGAKAFNGCISLTDIHFNGTIEQWNSIEKNKSWNYDTGDYTIYCTDGKISGSMR